MNFESLVSELLERGVMVEPAALDYLRTNPQAITRVDLSRIDTLTRALLEMTAPDVPRLDKGYRILKEYQESFNQKGNIQDFLSLFNSRYEKISGILKNRPEMKGLVSVNRLQSTREEVSVIGIVSSRRTTANGHVMVAFDDPTGSATGLITKNSSTMKRAEELVDDEVVGLRGSFSKGLFFVRDLIYPEVVQQEWPSGASGHAILISDTHVGSKLFLEDTFKKFTKWVRACNNIKYVFVAGDIVDGVGVYKGQEKELAITDIQKQYDHAASLFAEIPEEITIFISPGNHDATRESEPQPAIPKEFAPEFWKMKNVVMTSSPSVVQVEGIKFLMYHGASYDSTINSITALRGKGYDNPEQPMVFALKKRHLVPIYGESTRVFPEQSDQMVIEDVPNVMHSGHLHSVGFTNYKGVRVANTGTFQARTSFQVKLGHRPKPGIITHLNLETGEPGWVNFNEDVTNVL